MSGRRHAFTAFGDPRVPWRAVRALPAFARDLRSYRRKSAEAGGPFRLRWRSLYPRLGDRHEEAGVAEGHYFHQDIWAARRIHEAAPELHLDVGSRLDGFVAHLLAFREVTVLDIRSLTSSQPGLSFVQGDVRALPFECRSVPSLSCLHAMEHVGLGRYGDDIDPLGCFTGMAELQRVLAPGGRLYFSVPIGRERLEFNAHRIFAPETVLGEFDELRLVEFSMVDDEGRYRERVDPPDAVGATYSCGLFLFERPAS